MKDSIKSLKHFYKLIEIGEVQHGKSLEHSGAWIKNDNWFLVQNATSKDFSIVEKLTYFENQFVKEKEFIKPTLLEESAKVNLINITPLQVVASGSKVIFKTEKLNINKTFERMYKIKADSLTPAEWDIYEKRAKAWFLRHIFATIENIRQPIIAYRGKDFFFAEKWEFFPSERELEFMIWSEFRNQEVLFGKDSDQIVSIKDKIFKNVEQCVEQENIFMDRSLNLVKILKDEIELTLKTIKKDYEDLRIAPRAQDFKEYVQIKQRNHLFTNAIKNGGNFLASCDSVSYSEKCFTNYRNSLEELSVGEKKTFGNIEHLNGIHEQINLELNVIRFEMSKLGFTYANISEILHKDSKQLNFKDLFVNSNFFPSGVTFREHLNNIVSVLFDPTRSAEKRELYQILDEIAIDGKCVCVSNFDSDQEENHNDLIKGETDKIDAIEGGTN